MNYLPQSIEQAQTPESIRADLQDRVTANELPDIFKPLWQFYGQEPHSDAKTAYFTAVADLPRFAVVKAIKDFCRGRVEGHNAEFLPRPPKVGQVALSNVGAHIDALDKHNKRASSQPISRKPQLGNPAVGKKLRGLTKPTPFPDQATIKRAKLPPGSTIQACPFEVELPDGTRLTYDQFMERAK